MRDLQVFTPADADFFCAEPASHAPDAINRPDEQGMTMPAPGQTLVGSMTLSRVDGLRSETEWFGQRWVMAAVRAAVGMIYSRRKI